MLTVHFVFRAPLPIGGVQGAIRKEVSTLMPMPPRRGELIEHGDHYRVEDVRYEIGNQYQAVRAIVDCYAVTHEEKKP